MFCKYCGNKLSEAQRFCSKCGKPNAYFGAQSDAAPAPQQPAAPAAAPAAPASGNFNPSDIEAITRALIAQLT